MARLEGDEAGSLPTVRRSVVLLEAERHCGSMIHGQQYKALYGETQMGSSPMEVILMATRDAAKILGRENDLGIVEPGKFADLVILVADPLTDLRNVGMIHAVMKGGKLYKPDELITTKKTHTR